MKRTRRFLAPLRAAAVLVLTGTGSSSWAASRQLTIVTDVASGAGAGAILDWRPGAGRVLGEWRAGVIERCYVYVPGPASLAGVAAGRLLVRFGSGGAGFAADPTRRLGIAAATGPGITGGALLVRRRWGHALAVAGIDGGRAAAALGVDAARGGVVLGLVRERRPRLAAALRFGRGRHRCTIDGGVLPRATVACELRAPTRLGEGELDLRVPESGTVTPAGGPEIGYSPGLGLALRRAQGTLTTILGVHAELRSAGHALLPSDLARARRRRAFAEAALGIAPEMQARVRAEWRADDQLERARLRGEWRSAFASTAVDWTSGGGLLMQVRARWTFKAGTTLEAGSAAWSGPIADTGATLDLPAVPSHSVSPRFGRPGHQSGVLIDWQVRRIRVRLGWTTRQRRHELSEGLFAARMELVEPREQAAR